MSGLLNASRGETPRIIEIGAWRRVAQSRRRGLPACLHAGSMCGRRRACRRRCPESPRRPLLPRHASDAVFGSATGKAPAMLVKRSLMLAVLTAWASSAAADNSGVADVGARRAEPSHFVFAPQPAPAPASADAPLPAASAQPWSPAPAAPASADAAPSTAIDLTALRYFASQNDLSRVSAEISSDPRETSELGAAGGPVLARRRRRLRGAAVGSGSCDPTTPACGPRSRRCRSSLWTGALRWI